MARVAGVAMIRKQTVVARRIRLARVKYGQLTISTAAPDTSGLLAATQAALTAWRVAKLSEQSSTTSACATAAASAAASMRWASGWTHVPD